MRLTWFAVLALTSSLVGCSNRSDAAVPGGKRRIVDSAGGTVALGIDDRKPYRQVQTSAAGGIAGTLSLQGEPSDSMMPVLHDPKVCGDSASVTETAGDGTSLANVLVWIDSIDAGKPLPEVRRETLTIEHCQFEPRI